MILDRRLPVTWSAPTKSGLGGYGILLDMSHFHDLTALEQRDTALRVSLASQVERATPFAHRRPPQW